MAYRGPSHKVDLLWRGIKRKWIGKGEFRIQSLSWGSTISEPLALRLIKRDEKKVTSGFAETERKGVGTYF